MSKTKHVTLFGRRMRTSDEGRHLVSGEAVIMRWLGASGWSWNGNLGDLWTKHFKSPHAAARALERKIVAAHRRLGKLIGGDHG